MADGLDVARACRRALAGLAPARDRLLDQPRGGVVKGEQLRPRLDHVGESLDQDLGDALVMLLLRALEQRRVGDVLDERVLEEVPRARGPASLVNQLGGGELRERAQQRRLVHQGHRLDQLVRELAAEDRAELGHLARGAEAIESGHERVLQCGRNRQRREGPGQHVAVRFLAQQPRFQDHLEQLFDEERHPVGLGDHLPQHLGRKALALRQVSRHLLHVRLGEPAQRDVAQRRAGWPARRELEPRGQQRQHSRGRRLRDHEIEQFQRRRIGPVEVFPHREHWPLLRLGQQPGHQRFLRLLLLLRRRQAPRGGLVGDRQRQQRGEERDDLGQWQPYRPEHALQLGEPVRRRVFASPLERALERVDHGMEGAVGGVG